MLLDGNSQLLLSLLVQKLKLKCLLFFAEAFAFCVLEKMNGLNKKTFLGDGGWHVVGSELDFNYQLKV
jgi:hypothetical protein